MPEPAHGVVTHVCPKCSFVWIYPEQFEYACPSCGTSHPALSIDVLSERSERIARGEQVEPIISEPVLKDSPLKREFNEGVEELRKLIMGAETVIEQMNHNRKIDGTVKGVFQVYLERLQSAERQISHIYLFGDDPEGFVSSGTRKFDFGILPYGHGVGCPEDFCEGELLQHSVKDSRVRCNVCEKTWQKLELIESLFVPKEGDLCPKCREGKIKKRYVVGLGAEYFICSMCKTKWDERFLP